jgi:hypothetical protein
MFSPLASETIGTGSSDSDGCIESYKEQTNCLLDDNFNMWSKIDPKTNNRSEYILVVQPPNSKKKPSSFGSNYYCGIYSWSVLVDASNTPCRWRRDLAKEAFYAQSRVNMRRFACC